MSSSAKSSAAPSATSPLPLASFSSLPFELRAEIVALASTYPPDLHLLDHRACASLRLVSRDLYSLATPIFFKHVNLYRPSQLRGFLRLLTAKPAFGRLVKSLQLGTICLLDHTWWPMLYPGHEQQGQVLYITTSLEDKSLLPRWCCPRRRWPVYGEEGMHNNPRDQAVQRAFGVARRRLGVAIGFPGHTQDGDEVSSVLWLIRILELQAALDLYLMEMRRLEDAAGLLVPSSDGKPFGKVGPQEKEPCVEYPPLVLSMATSTAETSLPSARSDGQSSPFVITRRELLAHLARPRSLTDEFDHPLILARSGIDVLKFSLDGHAVGDSSLLSQMSSFCYGDASDGPGTLCSFALSQAAIQGRNPSTLPPDLINPLDIAGHNTSTVGGLVALARSVLALTPGVENLFVTGFLQASLCGSEAPALVSLRWLCLGPLSIHSDESLPPTPGLGRFANLEHLKLMGCVLSERKRELFASLPRLKTVEWNVKHSTEPGETAIESFKPLIGEAYLVEEPPVARRGSKKRTRARFESPPSDEEGWTTESEREKVHLSEDGDKREPPKILVIMSEATREALDPHLTARAQRAWCEDRPLCRRPHHLDLMTHAVYCTVVRNQDGMEWTRK